MSFPSSVPPAGVSGSLAATFSLAERVRAHLMRTEAAPCPSAASWEDAATLPAGLVDLRTAAPEIMALPAPPWSAGSLRFLVRPEVAERLRHAALSMPTDIRIGIWEGLRPVIVQRMLWESSLAFLRAHHPEFGLAALEQAAEQFVARPEGALPPHSTGSAVDLAPVDPFGRALSPSDAWGKLATEVMGQALRQAGLANYTPEWWHWSYGDAEWARTFDCAPLPFAVTPEFDGPGGGI
jgi:D-alanyl-D-alanine dipeptidase